MKQIKVAIIVKSLANKGPIKVMQSLIETSQELNLPIHFTVLYIDECSDLEVPVEKMKFTNKILLSQFDVIHTNGIRADLIGYLYRNRIKKHVVTIHNYAILDLSYSYNSLIGFLAGHIWMLLWRRADVCVCLTQTMVEFYKSKLRLKELTYVYNGIEGVIREQGSKTDEDEILRFIKPNLITVGTASVVSGIKGLDQIIRALALNSNYQFILIGDGVSSAKLKSLAVTLDVAERCLFLGSRPDAYRYYSHFDIFVMPSRQEGFGISLIEAARAKLPILCSDIPTFRELFDSDQVQFFELDNLSSIVDGLNNLSLNRSFFSENVYRKFISKYTRVSMAKNYHKVYSNLCDK